MTDMVRVGSLWKVADRYMIKYADTASSTLYGIFTVIKIEQVRGEIMVTVLEPSGRLQEYDYSIFGDPHWFERVA